MTERWVYGIHPVLEELSADPCRVEKIFIVEKAGGEKINSILELARARRVAVHFQPRAWIERQIPSSKHQNVVAVVSAFAFSDADDLLSAGGAQPLFVVLDQIEDPQNLGAILRNAEGAGVDGIFVPERHSAALGPAVEKASAGAVAHLKIARVVNLARLLEQMKDRGIWTVAVDVRAGQLWHQPDYRVPLALVLGSEAGGLRRLVRESCDFSVRLPMAGKVQSLNVSATAAVLLYEVLRQRGQAPGSRLQAPGAGIED